MLDDPVDDDSNGLIRVRIRTSHDQKDVPVVIRMRDTVAIIIEKLKQQAKVRLFSPRYTACAKQAHC
jgi:hypothetical protein